MKRSGLIAAVGAILGAGILLQCDLGGGSGGGGAEFDSTQYYTRAQIDAMFVHRPMLRHANVSTGALITGTGFGNHGTTWTAPEKLSAAVVMIDAANNHATDAAHLKLALSPSSDPGASFIWITVPAGGKFSMPVFWRYFSEASVQLKLWLHADSTLPAGVTLGGQPFYWFTGVAAN